jgi:hypothetical protein
LSWVGFFVDGLLIFYRSERFLASKLIRTGCSFVGSWLYK